MAKKDPSGNPRDTAIRYISMLSYIPMEPNDIGTAELKSRLEGDNFVVERRTIQRDLEKLSEKFPLRHRHGNGRELRWFFQKGTANQWPAMNADTALTLIMAEHNLKPLIPKQALNSVASLVNQAKETLKVQDRNGSKKKWSESVRIVPKGFVLQPAEIAPDVMINIFNAMGRQRQLRITNNAGKESVINPLGLVMRGPMLYLVSNYHGFDDIRITSLHRITKATLEMTDLVTPEGFDLDTTLNSGLMSWRLDPGKSKNFEIEVTKGVAGYLEESRINPTQTVKLLADGNSLVKFASEDTLELRQWLLGFGAEIVVKKPAAVRKWVINMGKEIVEQYAD